MLHSMLFSVNFINMLHIMLCNTATVTFMIFIASSSALFGPYILDIFPKYSY